MASAGTERLSREDWKKKQELDELVISCLISIYDLLDHVAAFRIFFYELQLIVLSQTSENPELSSLRRMLKEMKSIRIFHNIWPVRHGI